MSSKLQFDYFYGREPLQYLFFRIPKALIKDALFAKLSNDAKMLYGLMLDRMSLSEKKGWFDDSGRAYIIYTIDEIMVDLGCKRDKAMKVISELDSNKGVGLIERKRRGLGLPDIIYVKNFIRMLDSDSKSILDRLADGYFYGADSSQFIFYRIPKLLVLDPIFSKVSIDAKILYGLMLDRMSYSVENNWFDEEYRTYIIYTIDQIKEDMNCGPEKAVKLLAELGSQKGVGLIEKIRQGLNRPDIIYVKNFARIINNAGEYDVEFGKKALQTRINTQKSENRNSRSRKIEIPEVDKSKFKKSENQSSGGREFKTQEVGDSKSIKTEVSQTDLKDTDSINQSFKNEKSNGQNDGLMDRMQSIYDMFKENVDYDNLVIMHDKREVDELIELMVEVCVSDVETIRIGKEDKPRSIVQSRFEKFDYHTMEYVLDCLANNQTNVRNIKGYLLTTLFNAPATMMNHYKTDGR